MTHNNVINDQKPLLPVNQLTISRVTGDFRRNQIDIRYQYDESFLTSYYSTKSEKVNFFTKSAILGLIMVLFDRKFRNFGT